VKLLLDEHISPAIVQRLAELAIYAQSVPHVGLSGWSDRAIWQYALERDLAIVTTNARDFIGLLNVELHPGMIILRESGLTRDEQWNRLEPVIQHVLQSGDPDHLVNKLVEITSQNSFRVRNIP
jgi:predicted nuclease of predicted toxin-antitoxin system